MAKRHAVDAATAQALEEQGLTNPGGNGNSGRTPGESRGFNSETAGLWGNDKNFTDVMKPMEQASAVREFLHPGKDALELSGRTFFIDRNEAKLITQLFAWCKEFNYTDGEEDIKILMSTYNSVVGYARDQAAQVVTQTYRGSNYPGTRHEKSGQRNNNRNDDQGQNSF